MASSEFPLSEYDRWRGDVVKMAAVIGTLSAVIDTLGIMLDVRTTFDEATVVRAQEAVRRGQQCYTEYWAERYTPKV